MSGGVSEQLRLASEGALPPDGALPPEYGWVWDENLGSHAGRGKRIRQWAGPPDPNSKLLPWVLLNAAGNAIQSDRTTKQPLKTKTAKGGFNVTAWNMIKLSWRWGFDGCIAYNLFPAETPDPRQIHGHSALLGLDAVEEFQRQVVADISRFDAVMVAWGSDRAANQPAANLRTELARRVQRGAVRELWVISNSGAVSVLHPRVATNDAKPALYATLKGQA